MKKLLLITLASLPCLAAEDDGDWEFLKSRLPKEQNEFTTIRNPERTNTFGFVPSALKSIEGASSHSLVEYYNSGYCFSLVPYSHSISPDKSNDGYRQTTPPL